MARGDRREEIFGDDRDRSQFLGYLAEGAERYRVKVHCYVPDGSSRDDAGGQPLELDSSAEDSFKDSNKS